VIWIHDIRARASDQESKLLEEPTEAMVSEDMIRELRRVMAHAREDMGS